MDSVNVAVMEGNAVLGGVLMECPTHALGAQRLRFWRASECDSHSVRHFRRRGLSLIKVSMSTPIGELKIDGLTCRAATQYGRTIV